MYTYYNFGLFTRILLLTFANYVSDVKVVMGHLIS
jgi:hypothetical protein